MRRVSPVALAKEDTFRRVTPDEACGGCHGRRPVGLHHISRILETWKDGLEKALYETEGKHVSYRLKHPGGIKGVLEALGKAVRASTSLG